MGEPYVIATWPDGLSLTRPGVARSLVLERNGQGISRITFSPARLAVPNRNVPPRGGVRVLISGAASNDHSLLTDQTNGALIWTLHEIMRVPGHRISVSRAVKIPGLYRNEMLLDSLSSDLRGIEKEPPAFRGDLWKWTTDRFLRGADRSTTGPGAKRDGFGRVAGNLAGSVPWWDVLGGKTAWMHVPGIEDIGRGKTPSWSIKSPDRTELARSDKSPYDMLLKAGLMASDEDHALWMQEHGLPGVIAPELETYRLLGVTIPPMMGIVQFKEWLEGGDHG